ncbi:MAG: DEAD/DEAH box helicase family protein [Planctomycetes bacterium]|nr:DEAD/DEAH box helicase family protein [Planctomycetota bacterium]MCK5472727.1 DEAD/DEAH box helicase family protein [Planctomycetota bacterium]
MTEINERSDMQEIFGKGGIVSKLMPNFDYRPQQQEMAEAVNKALRTKKHLVVEAGTGVGKSFAYLLPAIVQACLQEKKVIISTFTITLQEQLINKDIPLLAKVIPFEFTAVLAKGRANYLCKRRLNFALRKKSELFEGIFGSDGYGSGGKSDNSQLEKIDDWAEKTKNGSLSDLPFKPAGKIWDAVKSENGNCQNKKCPAFRECFYWRARRKIEKADVIIANHALLFSDLALKQQKASVLPDYKYAIIDEAHNIENVAAERFGTSISNYKITLLLARLYNKRTGKGLLAFKTAEKAIEIIEKLNKESKIFFKNVQKWYENNEKETLGRCCKNFVDDNLSGYFKLLELELTKLAGKTEDDDQRLEITGFARQSAEVSKDLHDFLIQKKPDCIYWLEMTRAAKKTIWLKSASVDSGEDIRRCLFSKQDSVILTSATLSSGGGNDRGSFDFFTSRIGLDDFDAIKLGSPFDYQKQVKIYIEKDLPNPNEKDFVAAASEAIKKYVLKTNGRAFVLFTSYAMLKKAAGELAGWFDDNNLALLQQGLGVDRTTLLDTFKSADNCVLFGTDSFWQGVDVPGKALGNVIIVRLPFDVPDKPLLAGKLEKIKEKGGNAFKDYQLPSAVIKFKQGFGRLVRSKTDKGIVAILDNRIVNKNYGSKFLSAIPKCEIEVVNRQQ